MDQYQALKDKCYYVYCHFDPETEKIVYIGHGKVSRAWYFGSLENGTSDVSRCYEHKQWVVQLLNEGFTPDKFVRIMYNNMTKQAALRKELEYIHEYRPEFNKNFSYPVSLTEEQLSFAKDMRSDGMPYNKIADEINSSTMTVWRALNGKTQGY